MIMGKNILFVCKYNRFRSKIAEDLFDQINKNKSYKAKSAGIIRGSPINSKQAIICRKKNIILRNPPRGISSKLLKWQDVLVIVADDVPTSLFKDNVNYGKKLIAWRIPDAKRDNEKEIMIIIKMIENKVKKFVREIRDD